MKIRINNNICFGNSEKPVIIAEISANHSGKKKKFLDLIKLAHKNGADLIIDTLEATEELFEFLLARNN